MLQIEGPRLAALLDYPSLVEALLAAFRGRITVPLRAHHAVPRGDGEATLLLMPAWAEHGPVGVKIVTVFPGNVARGLPSVYGSYLLLDAETGAPAAFLDGTVLTARRTAAASALAARFLARPDARRLLVVGTGAIARALAEAHAATRALDRIAIWGRTPAKAAALAQVLQAEGLPAEPVADLAAAAADADLVSTATLAREPLVRGAWLRPGTHLDLVGGYTPAMREADDDAVGRARLFVDTRAGGLHEAGDIVDPLRRGVIGEDRVEADLFDLAAGRHPGRGGPDEITLFKSVGTAIEDLAAARLAVDRWTRAQG